MNTELIRLIDDALRQPQERRETWIDEACHGDAALAAELRGMLDLEANSSGILERPLHAIARDIGMPVAEKARNRIGTRIGPFRLDALIGTGGMGEVYRAEREDANFAQTVALKLIRSEKLTDYARERFLLERRILARMLHPHIARLIDGGVTDAGEPWFAMEYIDGEALLSWCDTHKLDIPARLRLMLDICGAVEFAHAHLVIHRDIKPGNVLVDADGTVKLLDFGIAKLLGDEETAASSTLTQMRQLTPEYAAPEQIRGEAVTTATDVHALGLILYELLCGQRAFGTYCTSPFDVQRELLESDAKTMTSRLAQLTTENAAGAREISACRQSDMRTLRSQLQGDLQYIVDKALRKDPSERYAGASALADDIRRYLANEPVLAAGGARAYRFGKFLRRHRLAAAFGAIVLLLLGAGISTTLWQAQRAERQARTSDAVREFLVDIFKSAGPEQALGKVPNAIDLLDVGARRVDSELRGQPEVQVQLLGTLGEIYGDLGEQDKALALLNQAYAKALATFGAQAWQSQQIVIHQAVVVANANKADAQVLHALGELIAQQQSLPESERSLLPKALNARGKIERDAEGKLVQSMSTLEAAVASARALGKTGEIELADALDQLATTQLRSAAPIGDVLKTRQESLQLYQRNLDPHHPKVLLSRGELALALSNTSAHAEAESQMRETAEAMKQVFGERSSHYAEALLALGEILITGGKLDEAIASIEQALHLIETTIGPDSTAAALALTQLTRARSAQGDIKTAITLQRRALPIFRTAGLDSDRAIAAEQNLAVLDIQAGAYAEADTLLTALLERQGEGSKVGRAGLLTNLGVARTALGHPDQAMPMFEEALALQSKQLGESNMSSLTTQVYLATAQRDAGQYEQARRNLEEVRRIGEKALPSNPTYSVIVPYQLVQLDYLQSRCDESSLTRITAHKKLLQATPSTPQWRFAQTDLLDALCRKQMKMPGLGNTRTDLNADAKVLLAEPTAGAFSRRIGREVVGNGESTSRQ